MGLWDDVDSDDWSCDGDPGPSEPAPPAATSDTSVLDAIDDLFALRWDRFGFGGKKKKPRFRRDEGDAEMSAPAEFSVQPAMARPESEALHPQTRKVQSRGAKRMAKPVRMSEHNLNDASSENSRGSRFFRFGSWRSVRSQRSERASHERKSDRTLRADNKRTEL